MKNSFKAFPVLIVFVFMLFSCTKSNNVDDNPNCQMTAKVDNTDFCGSGNFVHDSSTGVLTIQATNSNTAEIIQFTINAAAVGSFSLNTEGSNFGAYIINTSTYFTKSGTLVITKLNNDFVEGTFSFIGELLGVSETKNIANGQFKIPNLF